MLSSLTTHSLSLTPYSLTIKPISTLVYTNLVAFKLLPPLPPRMDPSSSLQDVVIDQARVQDQTKDHVWIKKKKLNSRIQIKNLWIHLNWIQ
jgi:hypothetical protein